MIGKIKTFIRNIWFDVSDTKRVVSPALSEKIAQKISESEKLHTGQICVCVEGGLPVSYLWRHIREGGSNISDSAHQRAIMKFSKLRVWDTESNNGVLIYILLSERIIEIIADRGVNKCVNLENGKNKWHDITLKISSEFEKGDFEAGLTNAINEISGILEEYFPAGIGYNKINELPDEPHLI